MAIKKEEVADSSLVSGYDTNSHHHRDDDFNLNGIIIIGPLIIIAKHVANIDVKNESVTAKHIIHIQCQSDLEIGVICIAAYCPIDGIIRVRLLNILNNDIKCEPRPWGYLAWIYNKNSLLEEIS